MNLTIQGQTITPFNGMRTYPLVYDGDVEIPGSTTNLTTGFCLADTLSPMLVKGKVVFCLIGGTSSSLSLEIKRAGGADFVLENVYGEKGIQDNSFMLPGAVVHHRIKYSIESGTSMSCPRVSAVAAILKDIHPDWSSAAIRSVLTTTAKLSNNMGTPITDSDENIANPF